MWLLLSPGASTRKCPSRSKKNKLMNSRCHVPSILLYHSRGFLLLLTWTGLDDIRSDIEREAMKERQSLKTRRTRVFWPWCDKVCGKYQKTSLWPHRIKLWHWLLSILIVAVDISASRVKAWRYISSRDFALQRDMVDLWSEGLPSALWLLSHKNSMKCSCWCIKFFNGFKGKQCIRCFRPYVKQSDPNTFLHFFTQKYADTKTKG